MKRPFAALYLVLPVTTLLLPTLTAQAITFTNDAIISFNNTNYDGLDIVITNCALTVDGPHAFASLQVLDAGVLTHTYSPSGSLQNLRMITNEPHVLSATNVATLSNTDVVAASIVVRDLSGLITYSNSADYVSGLDANGLTTLLLTTNSAIAEGSTNLVSYNVLDAPVAAGLSLTVTGDVTVAQGGAINVHGKGYGPSEGPGAGTPSGNPPSGSGAGHGGTGGPSAGADGTPGGVAYGSIQQPISLGSGGGAGYAGPGGAGGGSVTLIVGGTLRVDGSVSANGADAVNQRAGGGSGGSIWLSAQSFQGSGVLSANGGAGEPSLGGGGGGGRISIQFGTSAFTGSTFARSGSGYVYGGAGTIYTRANSESTGQVLVDNGGKAGANTPLTPGEAFDLTVQGGAMISLTSSGSFGNLLVASNAWISVVNQEVTVTGNASIQPGGGITADGAGYPGGQGQGAGGSDLYTYTGGGGGYGGFGGAGGGSGAFGGASYGFPTAPMLPGGGGGSYPTMGLGGSGGGTIRLTVGGTLLLDGTISANGSPGFGEGSGGGAGGSVWLTVGLLTGAGTISADGGSGSGFGTTGGGGGGGGRVAIQYGSYLFFGTLSARGASGSTWGGAGTIYTVANNQSIGQVLVDNGGQAGADTTLGSGPTFDLTVTGGAVVVPSQSQSFGTLLVAASGWLRITNQILTVTGNATVQAGGGIIADATGYGPGSGPGAGRYYSTSITNVGGGGGYGGYGAAGGIVGQVSAYGGSPYGSTAAPTDLGSGGGSYSTLAIGGAGGGAIRLTVNGVLQVDGRISAAGGVAVTPSAGGGSGGTIWLTVGTLSGSGLISANGGMGNYLGGGGGGGRIAVVYGDYGFSGLVSAYGGAGYAAGGAGTVFFSAKNQSVYQVVVDNGGQTGTNTSFGTGSPGTVDLTVMNGAVFSSPPSQGLHSLLVASNGWISIVNQTLTVAGNATVQAGGGIIADGTGYAAGQGQGAGRYYSGPNGVIGGGGGHGGYGASGGSAPSAYGGTTYGYVTSPNEPGSGGGGYYPGAIGGAGGGVIHLTVTGTLQVDGRISACGQAGTGPSAGGGSGGSVYLAVGALAGSGVISANGGAGHTLGGGGGGGRIMVSANSASTFSGLVSAYGGGGYAAGGAGTIYFGPYSFFPPWGRALVLIDNGGQSGTNTSWPSQAGADLTVQGGAVIAFLSSQSVGNLTVGSNSWVVVAASPGSVPTLTVNGSATVQAGGGIIADGTGYPAGQGQGAGRAVSSPNGYLGGGGGYGGSGGNSGGSGVVAAGGFYYGPATQPVLAGSGGGVYSGAFYGGAGGGGVRMNVTDTLQVDGRISAAGAPAPSPNFGGGSGGSVWLTAGTLVGVGVISANGGAGNGLGGGGGGGRIALQYSSSGFSGLVSARGGSGYIPGGAGTIYTKANSQQWGQLLVDNGGQAGPNTSWTVAGTVDLTVQGAGVVTPPGGQAFGNILVASNGWINAGSSPVGISQLVLTVTSNATVQAGGGIIADAAGWPSGTGPGAGRYFYNPSSGVLGGGGGYGGYGAASGGAKPGLGGITYGSVTQPTDAGSGGGGGQGSSSVGGAGGGGIRMNVIGSLLVNGRISANGGAGVSQGTGGGSGGSLWLTAGTLAGAGTISANGGAGNQLGGGGGGGCISLQYGVNAFQGSLSAFGGGGYAWGGAGTVYTKANSQTMGQILVDNGGHYGTNTPLAYMPPFDLTVRGGAVAYPSSGYLALSNLYVNAGGSLTSLSTQTNLDLAVWRSATIDAGGAITVDGKGFGAGAGPGAGSSTNSIGSGAGYGGNGGASSKLPGGPAYGSLQQPADRGSGGGFGYGQWTNGSEGGGAIRLTVGGNLTVNGRLSADGDAALQDNGGGGAGGSVWLTAGALAGTGVIAADGGAGELYQGGGGAGGRIAIYTPVNQFGGLVSVAEAPGAAPGQTGTVYYAAAPAAPRVLSFTPAAMITAAVSSSEVVFSTPVNPYSVSPLDLALTAPGGVAVSNLAVSALSPYGFQVTFPAQTAQGTYALAVGPGVFDLTGQPMSQAYTGTFSIVWAVVQGTITDTNGLPVADVVLQPDGGIPAASTDTNGNYVLGLPPAGTVQVTPSKAGLMFVPGSRSYTSLTTSITNENFLAVSTVAGSLAGGLQGTNYVLSWYGISGVSYQPLYSTNLVDWLPYDGVIAGTNGPLQLLLPLDGDPIRFFRVGASN